MVERVAITLSRGALAGLEPALAAHGLLAVRAPLIWCRTVRDLAPLRRGLGALDEVGTLVVTSPRAARIVARVVVGVDACRPAAVWAVGAGSALPLRVRFSEVSLPPSATAAALVDAMVAAGVPTPVLFARGDRSRDELPGGLRTAGLLVRSVFVYRTLPVPATPARIAGADLVVVGSPSAAWLARGVVGLGTPVVAIGRTTAAAAIEAGLAVRAVATTPDVDGVVAAIRSVVERRRSLVVRPDPACDA